MRRDQYKPSTKGSKDCIGRILKRSGDQLNTWATTLKENLEPLSEPGVFGYARWRKDWAKVSSELAQDRGVWGASIRYVVNSIGDAG